MDAFSKENGYTMAIPLHVFLNNLWTFQIIFSYCKENQKKGILYSPSLHPCKGLDSFHLNQPPMVFSL